MPTIVNVANCKLAELGFDKYLNAVFGLKVCENVDFNLLSLLLWAYKLPCSNKDKLRNIIAKLIHHCKDCTPKRYKQPLIQLNLDYTAWYLSQEYLDCLNQELLNNGFINFISPLVDLCKDLNIQINQSRVCKNISLQLSQLQVNCDIIPTIKLQAACNLNSVQINYIQTCNEPAVIIEEVICQAIVNNIISTI